MRTPNFHSIMKRLRRREERGAALVEFAIAIPILIVLLALVFDAGLGFTAARSSSSAARSAARIGALAGDERLADYQILDALRAQFGDGQSIDRIVVYKSFDTNTGGIPPSSCATAGDKCNEYTGNDLATLQQSDFNGYENQGAPNETCSSTSKDANWCPLGRSADASDGFLGVYVESTSKPTIGAVSPKSFTLRDRAVFAFYFPPAAATVPTPTTVVAN